MKTKLGEQNSAATTFDHVYLSLNTLELKIGKFGNTKNSGTTQSIQIPIFPPFFKSTIKTSCH